MVRRERCRVVHGATRARRQSRDDALLPPALNPSRVWARSCLASFSPPCARRSVCRGRPFVQPTRRPRARLARLPSEPSSQRLPVQPAPRVRRHGLLVGRVRLHARASRLRVGRRGQFVLRAGLLLPPGARRLPDPPAQARRGTFPAALFSPAQSSCRSRRSGTIFPSHSAYLVSCCPRDGPLARWSLHGTIETRAQAIFLNAARAALLQPVWSGPRFRHR